jgi:foldase protein PrsA
VRTLTRIAGIAAGALFLAACSGSVPSDAAATVNGETIPLDLLETQVEAQVDNPEGQFANLEGDERTTQIEGLQRQVLTNMIRIEMFNQLAEEEGIEVTEEEVQDRWDQEVSFQGDEQALRDLIESIGLTEEQAREQLRSVVAQEKLREQLTADLAPDEEELRDLYEERSDQWEQVEASHILVETEEEADAIIGLLERGRDFAELAEARSTDTGSAQQGGSLGSQPRGTFVPEFEEAVWNAEEGEIVGPVQTQFGFHVIRVDRFVTQSFEDVRDTLANELSQGEQDRVFQEYVEEAFQEAEIEVSSRFGEWDAETGAVVDPNAPTEAPAPGQPPVPTDAPTDLPPTDAPPTEGETESP